MAHSEALWHLPPFPYAASLAWLPSYPDAVFSLMPSAGRLFDSLLLFLPCSFFTQLSPSAATLFFLSLCLQNSRLQALKLLVLLLFKASLQDSHYRQPLLSPSKTFNSHGMTHLSSCICLFQPDCDRKCQFLMLVHTLSKDRQANPHFSRHQLRSLNNQGKKMIQQ